MKTLKREILLRNCFIGEWPTSFAILQNASSGHQNSWYSPSYIVQIGKLGFNMQIMRITEDMPIMSNFGI